MTQPSGSTPDGISTATPPSCPSPGRKTQADGLLFGSLLGIGSGMLFSFVGGWGLSTVAGLLLLGMYLATPRTGARVERTAFAEGRAWGVELNFIVGVVVATFLGAHFSPAILESWVATANATAIQLFTAT